MKLPCSDFIDAAALLVRPLTIACANAITSASVHGNLAILKILSIKSYIPLPSTDAVYPLFLVCFFSHCRVVFSSLSIASYTAERLKSGGRYTAFAGVIG